MPVLSIQVNCLDFSLAILYLILASGFLGWGFSLRKRERAVSSSRTKPLLTDKSANDVHSTDEQENSSGPMQVLHFSQNIVM